MAGGGMDYEIEGLEEMQDKIGRVLRRVEGSRAMKNAIAHGTNDAYRYAVDVTHTYERKGHNGGRLKNSLYPNVSTRSNEVYGVVGTNVAYAPYEHRRGGRHAFFDRTVAENGQSIVSSMEDQIKRDLELD